MKGLAAAAVSVALGPSAWAQSKGGPDILVVNLNLKDEPARAVEKLARELRRLAPGRTVEVIHYSKWTTQSHQDKAPSAVVLSPQGDPWWQYPPEDLERVGALVRGLEVPVLGVCGGHQFLAIAFGGEVAPIKGEIGAPNYDGMVREKGTTWVTVKQADPLLKGWKPGQRIAVAEYHAEEIKRVPKGFVVLVEGKFSPYQAIRHAERPFFGVQFHPESHNRKRPAGQRLLENFLKIVFES